MLENNIKYTINKELEIIESGKRTCLLPDDLTNVFVLNPVEAEIWKLFNSIKSVETAYFEFNQISQTIRIEYIDFVEFIEQLLEYKILLPIEE